MALRLGLSLLGPSFLVRFLSYICVFCLSRAGSLVVECLVRNQEVGGPIPPQSTIFWCLLVGTLGKNFFVVFVCFVLFQCCNGLYMLDSYLML